MRITLVNASPKQKNSASAVVLAILKKYLGCEAAEFIWNKQSAEEKEIQEIIESDVIIFAFPLYIDSVPSHLLRCMIQVEEYAKKHPTEKKPMLYVILNNGFFQGKQNASAIEVMRHWAKHCGFLFGQAAGIGGGGMISFIQSVPDGHGPKKNICMVLKKMSENILEGKSGENLITEPNYPAWAYKMQAEYGWRAQARKNGLKARDLNKQW